MGQIVRFPVEQNTITNANKQIGKKTPQAMVKNAEILFFTGVRYERKLESLPSERLPHPIARA